MKGLSPGCINLCYLLAMQMSLPKTIARLKTREERRRAWEELPDNSMKDMVKQRVIKIYKRGDRMPEKEVEKVKEKRCKEKIKRLIGLNILIL